MKDAEAKMKALLQVSTHLYQYLLSSGIVQPTHPVVKTSKKVEVSTINPDLTIGFQMMADAVIEYHTVRDREQTRRQEIVAQSSVRIAEIELTRDLLSRHLERSFDERRTNFEHFFQVLDRAQEKGDLDAMQLALSSILDLAKSSPFRDIQDFRNKMSDDTFVLEL